MLRPRDLEPTFTLFVGKFEKGLPGEGSGQLTILWKFIVIYDVLFIMHGPLREAICPESGPAGPRGGFPE